MTKKRRNRHKNEGQEPQFDFDEAKELTVGQAIRKNEEVEDEVNSLYNETVEKVYEKLQELNFSESLRVIWKLISRMNKYIDETMPWALAKDESKKDNYY